MSNFIAHREQEAEEGGRGSSQPSRSPGAGHPDPAAEEGSCAALRGPRPPRAHTRTQTNKYGPTARQPGRRCPSGPKGRHTLPGKGAPAAPRGRRGSRGGPVVRSARRARRRKSRLPGRGLSSARSVRAGSAAGSACGAAAPGRAPGARPPPGRCTERVRVSQRPARPALPGLRPGTLPHPRGPAPPHSHPLLVVQVPDQLVALVHQ